MSSVTSGTDEVVIEQVTDVTDELVEAFVGLIPQLSSSSPPPGADMLRSIIESDSGTMLIARDPSAGGAIVGSMTLITFTIPTGVRAWIEDVVVDGNARGKGVGDKLNRRALEIAQELGATTVDLTSRPSREAANRLYQRIGFEARETNVYRYKFG